jgi:uncharacterized integral membrane protein (TIGR00697 family)
LAKPTDGRYALRVNPARGHRIMAQPRYLPVIAGVFCGTLVCTIILSNKIVAVAGITFPASMLLFPATFLCADVLTEVYGYAATRKVVWAGFLSEVIWVLGYWAAAALPPAAFWTGQDAFVAALGLTPRIAVAGMTASVLGEFVNSYVMAKMKVWSDGRLLPLRMVVSTILGAGVDTLVVITIAFAGVFAFADLVSMGLAVWALKIVWELVALPVSIPFIAWLKRREGIDHFDRGTDFNPFSLDR